MAMLVQTDEPGFQPGPLADGDQLRRLHRAVIAMGSDLDLVVVLQQTVEAAAELVGARYGSITSALDPGTQSRYVDRPRAGFPVGQPRSSDVIDVPVLVDGGTYGHLRLADKRDDGPFTAIDLELATGLAAAAGVAIAKAQLHARLRRTDVAEDRDRIARDLHDSVVQHLFATGFTLQSALPLAGADHAVTERIEQAIDELDHVINAVRATVMGLVVSSDADRGIRRQVLRLGDELASALGFRPSFAFEGPVEAAVSERIAPHLLAAIGEALANVARHARGTTASVLVKVDGRSLCALVDDDGVGPRNVRIGGHGLTNLAHRASTLGGTCTLEARSGGGSRLRWQITV